LFFSFPHENDFSLWKEEIGAESVYPSTTSEKKCENIADSKTHNRDMFRIDWAKWVDLFVLMEAHSIGHDIGLLTLPANGKNSEGKRG
jgi:hypothetical protein